jgi:hypothetical protein
MKRIQSKLTPSIQRQMIEKELDDRDELMFVSL